MHTWNHSATAIAQPREVARGGRGPTQASHDADPTEHMINIVKTRRRHGSETERVESFAGSIGVSLDVA